MSVLARRRADYNEGHPATLPISSDLPLSEPVTLTDPDYFDCEPSLNGDEAAHFKREGFIVKRGLIDDTEIFQKVVDFIWTKVPRGLLRREDSDTWINPADDDWTEADSLKVGMLARDNWKIRSKGPSGIGTEALLIDGIANHPNVRQVVTALIGPPSGRFVASGVYTAFSLRHPAPKIATTSTLTISPVTSPPWSSWTRSVQVAAVSCSGPAPTPRCTPIGRRSMAAEWMWSRQSRFALRRSKPCVRRYRLNSPVQPATSYFGIPGPCTQPALIALRNWARQWFALSSPATSSATG